MISAISSIDEDYIFSYSYDPIGNRQTARLMEMNRSYTSNVLNQYVDVVSAMETMSLTYDADGNILTQDGWMQVWDGENRLVEMEKMS